MSVHSDRPSHTVSHTVCSRWNFNHINLWTKDILVSHSTVQYVQSSMCLSSMWPLMSSLLQHLLTTINQSCQEMCDFPVFRQGWNRKQTEKEPSLLNIGWNVNKSRIDPVQCNELVRRQITDYKLLLLLWRGNKTEQSSHKTVIILTLVREGYILSLYCTSSLDYFTCKTKREKNKPFKGKSAYWFSELQWHNKPTKTNYICIMYVVLLKFIFLCVSQHVLNSLPGLVDKVLLRVNRMLTHSAVLLLQVK